jgi:hypothetical protein
MTLPIDMTGAAWFVSQAIWEWEDILPTPVSDSATAQTPPAGDGTQGDSSQCESPDIEAAVLRELVFKGFTFDIRYNWVFTSDSPLAHPWQDDDRSDEARHHAHPLTHPAPDELSPLPEPPEAQLPAAQDPTQE